jgi:hypothetical protein
VAKLLRRHGGKGDISSRKKLSLLLGSVVEFFRGAVLSAAEWASTFMRKLAKVATHQPDREEPRDQQTAERLAASSGPPPDSQPVDRAEIPGVSPLSSSYVPYGIFFFNPGDHGFDGQRAVRERTANYDRRIINGDYPVHHGDLLLEHTLVRHNIRAILCDKGCRLDRLDAALKTALMQSADPGYRPYVIGMTGVQFAALAQADDRLKLDKVAGYKGLIFFALEDFKRAGEVGSGLYLPLSDINIRWY